MSLMRQLWLGVMLSALLALSGSFVISIYSAREYLREQLYLKNQDNAASLALLLSQQAYDPVTLELFIAAQYDTGHYELIQFLGPDGRIVIERHRGDIPGEVPAWFQRAINVEARHGQAQVNQGWRQSGTVIVISHKRFAYQSLWRGCIELLLWFSVGTLLTGLLGSIWVRRIRRPLDAVVGQAQAIQERRFISIAEPRIPELRSMARAMNSAVRRLQTMFEEEAARLEELRCEANLDALTGLANRSCFLAQLEQALQAEDAAPHGTLVLLRIVGLAELNRHLGRVETDNLLRSIADALVRHAQAMHGFVAGRLNGSDFALLVPAYSDGENQAQQLYDQAQAALGAWKTSFSGEAGLQLACGWSLYQHEQALNEVLGLVDTALARAETQAVAIAGSGDISSFPTQVRTMDEWTAILDRALAGQAFKLVSFPVLSLDGSCLHREALLRLAPEEGVWWSAAEFMPMACRLRRSAELDYRALELVLAELQKGSDQYSVNIDGASLAEPGFIARVEQMLRGHAGLASRLWLEVSEVTVFNHIEAFTEWCTRLRPLGVRLGIEHFGERLSGIHQLHGLGLAYLKIDGRFIQRIDERSGNQTFIRGLVGIGHALGVLVIAESVQRPEEWQQIRALGFDGATGPGVR